MKKDWKRHIAYEALVILEMLALLTFICRLWPILLLIILGIFIAALRLLFLSSRRVEVIEPLPLPLLPEPIRQPTEADVKSLAYAVILRRVTELVCTEYPEARWIWEASNAKHRIENGEEVYILLNRAGGYRRAKVVIQNLQVMAVDYLSVPEEESVSEGEEESFVPEPMEENYELVAFEWVEAHIFELNSRCNEAIGEGMRDIILTAEKLPAKESWKDICKELSRAGLEDVRVIPEGIKINLTQ